MSTPNSPPANQLVLDGMAGHLDKAQAPNPPWADPRPDLAEDHGMWLAVLESAYRLDRWYRNGVFQALRDLRVRGTGLALEEERRHRLLQPRDLPDEMWIKICSQLKASIGSALSSLRVEVQYDQVAGQANPDASTNESQNNKE